MNVCVGAAETLERVGKYSSSLFWYFTGRRDLYHPSLSTVTVFGQDPPYGIYADGWFFDYDVRFMDCISFNLVFEWNNMYIYTVYTYDYFDNIDIQIFFWIIYIYIYIYIYIDICIYMFSYVFSYVWRRYYFILLLLLGLLTPLWGSSLKYGTFHSQWVLWLILARKTRCSMRIFEPINFFPSSSSAQMALFFR